CDCCCLQAVMPKSVLSDPSIGVTATTVSLPLSEKDRSDVLVRRCSSWWLLSLIRREEIARWMLLLMHPSRDAVTHLPGRERQGVRRPHLHPPRFVRLPAGEPRACADREVRQLLRAGRDLLTRRQVLNFGVGMEPRAQHGPLRLEKIGSEMLRLLLRKTEEELMPGVPERDCLKTRREERERLRRTHKREPVLASCARPPSSSPLTSISLASSHAGPVESTGPFSLRKTRAYALFFAPRAYCRSSRSGCTRTRDVRRSHAMSDESNKRPIRRAASDQPARFVKDDVLGRGPFAVALATAITGWREPESLVVALTGPWGTGKSTIKNFVVEALEGLPETTRPLIVRFTPWDVAGTGGVADRLLHDIAVALKQPDASAAAKKLAETWDAWAEGRTLTATRVGP